MKIIQLNSATNMIYDSVSDSSVKILCDPWLHGEEYLGSWAIYPQYNFKPENFSDLDFIYVSHIHPDHSSANTLSKLSKKIPVLIHNFPEKFLKNKIENLGFKTIELEHGIRIRLKNNLHVNIMAADNCDPNVCGKIMGCGLSEVRFKTTQIDTMVIFDNCKQVIVNTNDCPFDIAKNTATIVKSVYHKIDALLIGYVAASSWPHCYNLSEAEKEEESRKKQNAKLETAKKYIELLQPKYYIPFAGRYTLCGKNAVLNQYRGEPELEDAFEWLRDNIEQKKYLGVILNNDCWLDVDTGNANKNYVPINKNEKKDYVNNILSRKKLPYENEPIPITSEILGLIPKAYENFEKIRRKIGWISDVTIILKTTNGDDDLIIAISCNGNGFNKISDDDIKKYEQRMIMSLDIRLLKWLLYGPDKAHWSDADLGSHLRYERVGSVYKRGLFYCWNYFCAVV